MAVITTIRPTTEVEAINVMLGAIGEAPLPSNANLSALESTDTNIESAVGILRETVREVLTAGWRFNTLTGYVLEPSGTVQWRNHDGSTETLNVFKVPDGVLAWTTTPCMQNLGIDLVERLSMQYVEDGQNVLVMFDRVRNRDGLDETRYPYIFIDGVFACDFIHMPESARRYATVVAARRLAQRLPASETLASFTAADERAALRVLKREQGLTKPLNLFATVEAFDIAGHRPTGGGGFYARVYPGGR